MKIHDLKCWPQYFEAILEGKKTFEVRYNDRGYEEGDVLLLQEYDMREMRYTGRSMKMLVGYILQSDVGVRPGWVAMTIIPTGNACLERR